MSNIECCESTQSCETNKAHIVEDHIIENKDNSVKIEDIIEDVNQANTEEFEIHVFGTDNAFGTDNVMNYDEIPDPICCVRFTIFVIFIILIFLILFIISVSLCSIENKCSLFRVLF